MHLGNLSKAVAVAVSVLWAAGCSTTSTTSDTSEAMDATEETSTAAEDSASAQGTGRDEGLSEGQMDSDSMSGDTDTRTQPVEQDPLDGVATTFYFDFDQAVIKPQALDDLNTHAEYLMANPNIDVRLEGHADERGTREYNMALGERRAKAVERYLTLQGVAPSQLEVISYGEEQPAMLGHFEAAWSKNRRVEMVYNR